MSELDIVPSSVTQNDDGSTNIAQEDKNSDDCFEIPTEIAFFKISSVNQTMSPMISQQSVIIKQEIHGKEYSPTTEETQISDEIHTSVPLFPQELTLDVGRNDTEKPFVFAETKQACDEDLTFVPFRPQESRVGLIENHKTEHSPTFSEKTSIQLPEETHNTSNPFVRIFNENHTLPSMKSDESTEVKPKKFRDEGTFYMNSDFKLCNKSSDLPLRFDRRNKFKAPHSINSYNSCRRAKTPPLRMSRTSDTKECLHILFLLVLGVLAFGVFYFLQAFKPKSNTAVALGSVSGGVILLILFCCMYNIVKKDGLYCMQNSTPNV